MLAQMESFHVETEHYIIWLENGITHLVYKPGFVVTLDIAKQIVKKRIEVSGGITRPAFIDITRMVAVNKEARKYLAREEAARHISAGAIYLDNYVHYLAGRVFLNIDKPNIPSKLFTCKEKALRWLEPYKNLS